MAGKLWNSREYVEAFAYYKRYMDGDEDTELLYRPLTQRHIDDLTFGARTLLKQRGNRPEHIFSDDAVAAVRLGKEYIRDLTLAKQRLITASVIGIGGDEFRFSRTYSTRRTMEELMASQNLQALRQQYDPDPDEDLGLESVLVEGENPYEFEQTTTILYHQSDETPGGTTVRLYPDGRSERQPSELLVVDYMTLGHLIEFDKR